MANIEHPVTGRQIGPLGTAVRLCVGIGALIFVFADDPSGFDLLAGLFILPAAEMIILGILRRPGTPPVRLYGSVGYLVNYGIGAGLLILWTTPALLFYGVSIFLAVAKGYAGCEILAVSNLIRRRDDQLACAVFSPIDAMESRAA
jgi:hypothetical protein